MSRLLLVRHGESEWNAHGRVQGQGDPPLSSAGREQARRAAEALEGLDGPVVSSDLRRAHQTAEALAEGIASGPVLIEPDLREIDVGRWTGLTHAEIEGLDPEEYAAWRSGRLEAFPDGETRRGFTERVLRGVGRAAAEGARLVVAHGGVLRAIERHCGLERGPSFSYLDGFRLEIEGEVRVLERVRLLG